MYTWWYDLNICINVCKVSFSLMKITVNGSRILHFLLYFGRFEPEVTVASPWLRNLTVSARLSHQLDRIGCFPVTGVA